MALAISGLSPQARMEQLLCAIEGILAARVVVDDGEGPVEIHVVSPPGLHPKQVVRNVESALGAGLGIEVDRRIVSVARVADDAPLNGSAADASADDDAHATSASTRTTTSANGVPDDGAPTPSATDAQDRMNGTMAEACNNGRLLFAGFDTERDVAGRIVCRVKLRDGEREFAGVSEGPDTPAGRAETGARAAFDALARARDCDDVALEGVALVQTQGRTFVHLAAHASVGRSSVELTGTALVGRSPDEAAVLAALQATNRWTEIPD